MSTWALATSIPTPTSAAVALGYPPATLATRPALQIRARVGHGPGTCSGSGPASRPGRPCSLTVSHDPEKNGLSRPMHYDLGQSKALGTYKRRGGRLESVWSGWVARGGLGEAGRVGCCWVPAVDAGMTFWVVQGCGWTGAVQVAQRSVGRRKTMAKVGIASKGRPRCVQRGWLRFGRRIRRRNEGAPTCESTSGAEQAGAFGGSCITRSWVPGRPLTEFGRGRPILPLPLERVKSGHALEVDGRFASVSSRTAVVGRPGRARRASNEASRMATAV